MNAAWLVVASVCIYFIAYRFYALFITGKVFGIDPKRVTPAYRHNDGLDYVPTNKYVLFGHHFAAIAGAGPLVGPVLAAQMGYLPGTLWILAGVVFAGAPLRHPVRGTGHSDHGRCRHAGLPVHDPGPRRQRDPGVQGDRVMGQQHRRLGVRLRVVGLLPVSGRDRSSGRHLDDVAAVRHRQPDAGGDRFGAVHGRAVQDEASARGLGHHRADSVAGAVHGDGGAGESVQSGYRGRLRGARDEVRRGGGGRQVLAPAKSLHEMGRIVFNDYLDAGLAGLFAAIVLTMVVYGILDARKALRTPRDTTVEITGMSAMAAGDD